MSVTKGKWCPTANISHSCQPSMHLKVNRVTSESYPMWKVMDSTIKCRIHKIQKTWLISDPPIASAGIAMETYTEVTEQEINKRRDTWWSKKNWTYSMVQSPSWEANWFAASQEIRRIFMEPEGSLPHSQASATCPYPGPAQSSSHTHIPLPGDPP
jgi:hypothetical protein